MGQGKSSRLLASRAGPSDAKPSSRRAALERTPSQTSRRKQAVIDVHARFRGRHCVFAHPLRNDDGKDDVGPAPAGGGCRSEAFEKTEDEIRFIEDTLTDGSNCFLFDPLTEEQRRALIDGMELVRVDPDEMIIRRGDEGDYFYVTREGTVAVYVGKDEAFGARNNGDGESLLDITTSRRGSNEPPPPPPALGHDIDQDFHQSPLPSGLKTSLKASVYQSPATSVESRRVSTLNIDAAMLPQLDEEEPQVDNSAHTAGDSTVTPFSLETERYVRDCGPGDTFGELALMYSCPRTATCVSKTPCVLWRVDAKTFHRVMKDALHDPTAAHGPQCRFCALAGSTLKPIPIFSTLDTETLCHFAQSLVPAHFRGGERIIQKGEEGNTFYVIQEGRVKFHDIGFGDAKKCDIMAGPGEFFGERALLTGEKRAANVTAISDKVVLLAMGREDFEKRLGPLQYLIDRGLHKKMLMSVPNFAKSQFEPHEIEALLDLFEPIKFPAGRTIVRTGENTTQALYLMCTGQVQVTDEKKGLVSILKRGDHFGGTTLEHTGPTEEFKCGYTVEVLADMECGMITRSKIESVIGSLKRLGKPLPPAPSKLDDAMTLKDLKLHRILGVGSFGRVWLAQHVEHPGSVYALKVMDKQQIAEVKMHEGVIREKNVLASIDHPLIVNLVAAFQDDHSLYMVQDFLQGGELFTLLHQNGSQRGVNNDAAVFYSACMLESLGHLHRRNICYRDLKPENVILDCDGYCVLIDLGFAKVVVGKTYTMCGSPEYLAPEVILGTGHNKGTDHWSLGVVIYELLVGQTPFIHRNATQMSLFQRIVKRGFAFPSMEKHGRQVASEAQDLIRGLLTKSSMDRLGSLAGGEEDIKHHPWFRGMFEDSSRLLKKQVQAPWVPEIKDPLDASHFELYDDVEKAEKSRRYKRPNEAIQKLFVGF